MQIKEPDDFEKLYEFALTIPELRVSQLSEFMRPAEFMAVFKSNTSICLVALENDTPVGFILARMGDADCFFHEACVVYLAVAEEFRKQGVAQALFEECKKRLIDRNVSSVYCWADENSGVIYFMQKQGFIAGKRCVWMDCQIQ